MDLDKIFGKKQHTYKGTNYNYVAFIYDGKTPYEILLWVGCDANADLSSPPVSNLSLNDYTHFGIRVECCGYNFTKANEMKAVLGFNFDDFRAGLYCQSNQGYNVPKAFLIKILQKAGIISEMPDDAGDGE